LRYDFTRRAPGGFNGQDASNDMLVPVRCVEEPRYAVRRLTPEECAWLQGFPDWWCADLGTEHPSEHEIEWWQDVFETTRRITGSGMKPKTKKQILKWLNDPYTDAAEYKLWGNGVALPCVVFVLFGILSESAVYLDEIA
jgi:DNA (cytosine-5)-methyltransferase 1